MIAKTGHCVLIIILFHILSIASYSHHSPHKVTSECMDIFSIPLHTSSISVGRLCLLEFRDKPDLPWTEREARLDQYVSTKATSACDAKVLANALMKGGAIAGGVAGLGGAQRELAVIALTLVVAGVIADEAWLCWCIRYEGKLWTYERDIDNNLICVEFTFPFDYCINAGANHWSEGRACSMPGIPPNINMNMILLNNAYLDCQ